MTEGVQSAPGGGSRSPGLARRSRGPRSRGQREGAANISGLVDMARATRPRQREEGGRRGGRLALGALVVVNALHVAGALRLGGMEPASSSAAPLIRVVNEVTFP